MDSVNVFKGYGKVDNIEDQSTSSHRNTTKTKRSLITIITISSILLLTLIIGASLLALIHESNTESSEDEAPSSLSSKTNPAESIKLVCNVTRYPESCFTSLSSLNASPKPDPESIFKLSLRVSISELSTLSSYIKNLTLDSNSNSNGAKSGDSALKDCQELLDEAVSRLNESVALMEVVEGEKVLTERKISDIQTWVSAALTNKETCMDGLEETESTALIEVKSKVQKCSEYISNTLAIVANIHTLLDKFGLTLH